MDQTNQIDFGTLRDASTCEAMRIATLDDLRMSFNSSKTDVDGFGVFVLDGREVS